MQHYPQHPRGPMPRRPGRQVRLLAAAAVALAALTACQPVQPLPAAPVRDDVTGVPVGDTAVREGGDLVMALSAEPDRLDPTTSSSLYTRYVMQTMCQKLYDIDAEGELVPQLATAFRRSPRTA